MIILGIIIKRKEFIIDYFYYLFIYFIDIHEFRIHCIVELLLFYLLLIMLIIIIFYYYYTFIY